jgi:peptide/nickel transport system ATP-binding protein
MKSVPRLTGEGISDGIPGRIPNYLEPPSGCRFHPRCEHVMPVCKEAIPSFYPVDEDHFAACYLYRS